MSKAKTAETVPLHRQYAQIKARYPDHILLFRIGDFYETFDEDARVFADVVGTPLASRQWGDRNETLVAGVIYHKAEEAIAALIASGRKAAICDRVGPPRQGGYAPGDPGVTTAPRTAHTEEGTG